MPNETLPNLECMTRRDYQVLSLYSFAPSNTPLVPKLGDTHRRIDELKRLVGQIERDAWARKNPDVCFTGRAITTTEADEDTLDDLRKEIKDLEATLPELEFDHTVLEGQCLFLVGKREGFIAGIQAAAVAYHMADQDAYRLVRLMRCLSDNAYADQYLHDLTKDLPEPLGNHADFFPAPDQIAEAAASVQPEEAPAREGGVQA